MNVKIHRWTWLTRKPCAVCGLPTSRWFQLKMRDGRPFHFHCSYKETP